MADHNNKKYLKNTKIDKKVNNEYFNEGEYQYNLVEDIEMI